MERVLAERHRYQDSSRNSSICFDSLHTSDLGAPSADQLGVLRVQLPPIHAASILIEAIDSTHHDCARQKEHLQHNQHPDLSQKAAGGDSS